MISNLEEAKRWMRGDTSLKFDAERNATVIDTTVRTATDVNKQLKSLDRRAWSHLSSGGSAHDKIMWDLNEAREYLVKVGS